jgi:hypothetical protein
MGRLAEMQRKLLEVQQLFHLLPTNQLNERMFPGHAANDGTRGYGSRECELAVARRQSVPKLPMRDLSAYIVH